MSYDDLRKQFDNPAFRREMKMVHPPICSNCGSSDAIEYHHIVPLFFGGTNNFQNIVPLCHRCHKSAHHGRDISHYAKAVNPGRKSMSNIDKDSDVFDMFINGEIGNRKCCELLGYSKRSPVKDRPEFKRYIKSKGIKNVRNFIDVSATNRKNGISDGDVVGVIEYIDGRKEDMIYSDTGMNDIEYLHRA